MRRRILLLSATGVVLGLVLAAIIWPPLVHPLKLLISGRASVADRVAEYGPGARHRLKPFFAKAELAYPPARFALVGLKSEKRLELYAAGPEGPFKFVKSYPVLAASGNLGPKLKEGDRQVPEGVYRIESLNPNSRYHLALRIDYPNEDDRQRAAEADRADLGSDIMIHGRDVSIGCFAMGDSAAEELFVLAADVGWSEAQVVFAPVDLRRVALPPDLADTPWAWSLYPKVQGALAQFPAVAVESGGAASPELQRTGAVGAR
jgi:hypothetical protein